MKHNLPKMHHQDATTRFGQRFGFYQIETKCLKTPGRIATKIPWHEVGIHESFWECKLNHAIWQRIPQIQRNHHPISIISQPLKKNIQKQKCHHFPTKKKTFKKKKLPPSYYTHLVLIGISASRLLVVFFATIMTPGGKARPVLHDIQKHPALLELSAFSTCSNGCCTFRGIGKGKIFWW